VEPGGGAGANDPWLSSGAHAVTPWANGPSPRVQIARAGHVVGGKTQPPGPLAHQAKVAVWLHGDEDGVEPGAHQPVQALADGFAAVGGDGQNGDAPVEVQAGVGRPPGKRHRFFGLDAGQPFQNFGEVGTAVAWRNGGRHKRPGVGLDDAVAGAQQPPRGLVEAVLAAGQRVDAVGDEAHALPLVDQARRQRGSDLDGPLGDVAPVAKLVVGAVQVEQDGRFQRNGRLERFHHELTRVGARFPVNLPHAVARAKVADAHRAGGVFKQPLVAGDGAEGQPRRQPQLGERRQVRVDGEVVGGQKGDQLRVDAKQVAGGEPQRAELVVALGGGR
jgi:hypothetical protein